MVRGLFILIISLAIFGCGKATKMEAHKPLSQMQTKQKPTEEKSSVKEIESVKPNTQSTLEEKEESPEPVLDSLLSEKVEKALNHVEIPSFKLSLMLPKEEWNKAQKFSFAAHTCGIGHSGPRCYNFKNIVNKESKSFFRFKGQYYFYVEFKTAEKEPPMAFLFHFEKVDPEVILSKVSVYHLRHERSETVDIMTYLNEKSSTTYWTELSPNKIP